MRRYESGQSGYRTGTTPCTNCRRPDRLSKWIHCVQQDRLKPRLSPTWAGRKFQRHYYFCHTHWFVSIQATQLWSQLSSWNISEVYRRSIKGSRRWKKHIWRHNGVWQESWWGSTGCPSENERKQSNCKPWQVSVQPIVHRHFSADGISADEKKISSLINASPPKNATGARSFLGLAQYLARFIKDFASISAPIRQLTHKNAKWVWGPEEQHAFVCLKARMATPEIMKYFNPSLETELIVDASPVGLGAILTQVTADGGMNIVAYASRSLTDCESRYSQTEREALAVIWGIEHFHLYLYGSSFRVITDHKPLETIFNNPTCKATARLERLQLRLQPYKTAVVYKPGADNPVDYMSRHPDPKQSQTPCHLSRIDAYVNFVTTNAVPSAVTLQEIKDAAAKDDTLENLARVITQKWHEVGKDVGQYQQIKQELSVSNGIILRGTRIIGPERLRQRVIMLAHSVFCETQSGFQG